MVVSEFGFDSLQFGPGIIRVNATLLDDPEIKENVFSSIQKELTKGVNPHQTLDHYKYLLRKNLLLEGKKKMRQEKTALEMSNIELDKLRTKLDSLLTQKQNENASSNHINDIYLSTEIDNLRDAIEIANEPLNNLKNEESKRLIFRSKAKWVEEGEKSNKYFLNLLKGRKRCKLGKSLVTV